MLANRTAGLDPFVSSGTSSVWRSFPNTVVRASIETAITWPELPPTRSGTTDESVAVWAARW